MTTLHPAVQDLLRFFEGGHLSSELQPVSREYRNLALWTVENTPSCAEQTVALRKLLEAKDCAVRASLPRD